MYPKCLISNPKPCRIRQSGPLRALGQHTHKEHIYCKEHYRDQLALSSGCPLWSTTNTTFEATTSVNESTRRTLPFQLNYPSSIHRDWKNKKYLQHGGQATHPLPRIFIFIKLQKNIN